MRVSKPTTRELVSVVVAMFAVITFGAYTQTASMSSGAASQFPIASAIVTGAIVTAVLVVTASYFITVEETADTGHTEVEQ